MTAVLTSATCESPAGPEDVAYVQVTPDSWNPTALGEVTMFRAVATTWLGKEIKNLPVAWSSDPPGAVFVDMDGSAYSHEPGAAQVHATISGVTGTAQVNIVQIIESVEILSYFGNTIPAGDSIYLYVDARDRNAFSVPGTRFTLQSLNPSVAAVTAEGWVKGISAGDASIVAMAAGHADTGMVVVYQP